MHDNLLPPLAVIEQRLTQNQRERRILRDLERLARRAARDADATQPNDPDRRPRRAPAQAVGR